MFHLVFLYKNLYLQIRMICTTPTQVVSSQLVQYSLSCIVYAGEIDQFMKFIFLYEIVYRRIRLIYANPTHFVSFQSV